MADEHGHEHPPDEEHPVSNPIYDALDEERQHRLNHEVEEVQRMQDMVDGSSGLLGQVVFFLGDRILKLTLAVEALAQKVEELEAQ